VTKQESDVITLAYFEEKFQESQRARAEEMVAGAGAGDLCALSALFSRRNIPAFSAAIDLAPDLQHEYTRKR
jgi:hypothetical protein